MASETHVLLARTYVASTAVSKYRFVKVATSTMKVSMAGDDEMEPALPVRA